MSVLVYNSVFGASSEFNWGFLNTVQFIYFFKALNLNLPTVFWNFLNALGSTEFDILGMIGIGVSDEYEAWTSESFVEKLNFKGKEMNETFLINFDVTTWVFFYNSQNISIQIL